MVGRGIVLLWLQVIINCYYYLIKSLAKILIMNAVTLVETSVAVPLIIKDVRTLDQKIEDAKNRIKSVFSQNKVILGATSLGRIARF